MTQAAPDALASCLADLAVLFGDRISLADDVRNEHAKDSAHHQPQPPDAVVFPLTSEDVANCLSICNRHRVPVIPFGTGTAVEGGVVATQGGVTVDVQRMNRIVRLSAADMDVTVEAGVTRQQLNRYLLEQNTGLHFPVDP